MEAVKKYWFWGIFISILSIFAMSHNAKAIDFTLNLNDYNLSHQIDRPNIDVVVNGNALCSNAQQCAVYDTSNFSRVQKLKMSTAVSSKANDIVVLRLFIGSQSNLGTYTSIVPFIQRNFTTNNSSVIYLGYDEHIVSNQNILSQLGYGPNANEFYTQISTIYQDLRIVEYYFKVLKDDSYKFGFESTYYAGQNADIFTLPAYSSSSAIYFKIISLTEWFPIESKENKEVEQKTQEAVDDSQAAGGSSSTDAQTGTTGLLNAITGAVSVISSAQPTNCKINGNMGNLDIGQLDLCANPAPAFIQTIGSLILILMCVPLAISLFNRFIAIFRSFQS